MSSTGAQCYWPLFSPFPKVYHAKEPVFFSLLVKLVHAKLPGFVPAFLFPLSGIENDGKWVMLGSHPPSNEHLMKNKRTVG